MINIKDLKYKDIKKIYNKKKYIFFDKGKYNLNLFAIRSNNRVSNSFDDYFGVAYIDINNKEQVFIFECTTDPGTYWLKNLMDIGGTAIIVPDQYRSLWKLGTFYKVLALIQINNIKIYRDGNKDDIIDIIPKSITEGIYGIFFHEHYQNKEIASYVEKSSAGCIVPKDRKDHRKIMHLCLEQIRQGLGTEFTFTLFEENDLL